MIYREEDHPVNQSRSEILGRTSGGFSISEKQATCDECGTDIDHGDDMGIYSVWKSHSIHHTWNRISFFCRECKPRSLDADALDEYTSYHNEVLVTGTLRSKGYWGTYVNDDGESEKRWTYQDGKWAEFAATRVEDLKTDPESGATVTEVGPTQFSYYPGTYGGTIPVPATVLSELVANTTLDDDSSTNWDAASTNPVRWAKCLLAEYDDATVRQNPWEDE